MSAEFIKSLVEATGKTAVETAVRNDPRVEEISDERNTGEGVWAYLKDGYCWGPGGHPSGHHVALCVHTVHENTWSEVKRELRGVIKCDCMGCTGKKNDIEAADKSLK